MACALTQGYSLDCRDSVGGSKEFYFIEFDSVSAMTETAGVITALTKVTGKRFWKYAQVKEVSEGKSTQEGSEANGSSFWSHEVSVLLHKRQTAVRNEILLLSKNRLLIVEKDNNGKFWLYGRNGGMLLEGGASGSGKAYADLNGYTLPFKGMEKEPEIEVDSTIAAQLETAGV
jgi:hypothetical protein